MNPEYVRLSKEEHANLKIKPGLNMQLIEGQNAAPVVLQEALLAAAELPIAFIKDQKEDSDKFFFVSLLGLGAGQNHYYDGEKAKGNYVHFYLTHHPFSMVVHPEDQDRFLVLIDKNSQLVNESEGESLFKEDGSDTDYLATRVRTMANFYKNAQLTQEFVEKIVALDLLVDLTLKYTKNGEEHKAAGIYAIDESKLNQLSDEAFNELRRAGFLPAIYAHIISMNQIGRLVRWANEAE